MHKRPTLRTSLLFICVFVTAGSAAAKTEPASEKINSKCLEAQYATHLADELEKRTTGLNDALTTLSQHAAAWQLLAATSSGPETRAAAYVLATAAENEVTEKAAEIQSYTHTLQQAVTRLRRRAQLAQTLNDIIYTAPTEPTTAANGAAGSFICNQVFTPTIRPTNPECMLTGLNSVFSNNQKLDLQGIHTIKLLAPDALTPAKAKVAATTKGTQESYVSKTLTAGKCDASSGGLGNVYVQLELTASHSAPERTAAVNLHAPAGPGPSCIAEPDTAAQIITNNAYVIAAVCRALHAKAPAISKPEDYAGDALATNKANQRFFGDYIEQTTGQQMTKDQITAKLKDMYSTKGNNFENNFIKTLNSVAATYTTEDNTKTGKLLEIAKGGNTVKALAYLDARRTDTKKKADDGSEKDGTKKTDTKDKAGEKKDGDNKTATNTTGSNSFVINKTPLWLAFLLF